MNVMEASLKAGYTMHAWIRRGGAVRGMQVPFDLLVDRWFHETMAASDEKRMESNVTRIGIILQVVTWCDRIFYFNNIWSLYRLGYLTDEMRMESNVTRTGIML
jgi:hypothetical protein